MTFIKGHDDPVYSVNSCLLQLVCVCVYILIVAKSAK